MRTRPLLAIVAVLVLAVAGVLLHVSSSSSTAASHHGTPGTAVPVSAAATPSAKPTGRTPAPTRTPAQAPTARKKKSAQPPAARRPGERLVTMVNRTGQTIWPALGPDPRHPTARTGWTLPPGGTVAVWVPNGWNARIWARTGCHFDASGHGHCATGDCGGLLQCKGWGALPTTLAEFNLNAWRGMDFYDVSLVDGNNVPMWINHTGGTPDKIGKNGCVPAGCTRDANLTCPKALQQRSGGVVIDCRSACLALGDDQSCCRAQWAPRSACAPARWKIDSAAVFKKAEPFAYSYVDDDATSVFTCTGRCDYQITWGTSP